MSQHCTEIDSYIAEVFDRVGAEVASVLFALELSWPADTPDRCFESAWDMAHAKLRMAVAEEMIARGVIDQRSISILQDIAVNGFTDRFTELNHGWMSQGGTA